MSRSPLLAVLLFFLSISHAQNPTTGSYARVEGLATNLAGDPLNKATLRLSGESTTKPSSRRSPPLYVSITGADGTFVFENVEPGRYQIFAERAGYLREIYTTAPGIGPYSVDLAAGQRLTANIKLTPQSIISGTITDEDGDPFPGARVNVYRPAYGQHRELRPGPATAAGLDGTFSLGSLSAGRYYLAVSGSSNDTPLDQREVPGRTGEEERYVTTYYPGVLEISAAALINVPVGTEIRGMHIRVRKGRVFRISGKMVDAEGTSRPGTVNLLFKDVNNPSDSHTIQSTDGSFEFNRLLPGTYILLAYSGSSRELVGREIVAIANQDLEDTILPLGPGAEIKLIVRTEEADAQAQQELAHAIASTARYTLTPMEGPHLGYLAQNDGDGITLLFKQVAPGQYYVGVSRPAGTYVKSMRFGSQDVTDKPIDTTSGNQGPLDVVISPHAAEINGVLRNSKGETLSGIEVTVWRPGIPPADFLPFVMGTVTDSNGLFTFEGLPPGEYRVAGWENIDPGMAGIPDFHHQFDQRAATVKLTEDVHISLEAPMIDRAAIELEAAKFR